MAARKGKGRQAVRNNSSGFPGWGYAVIGVVIGAILIAIYRWFDARRKQGAGVVVMPHDPELITR